MRSYRSLLFVICILSSFLLSFVSASEKESDQQELNCETLMFFFNLWEDSAFGQNPNGVERAAWIIREGEDNQIFQKWRNSGERNKEIWKGAVPANLVGVVHTHPAHRDSRPSPADVSMAKRLGISVYVISVDGVWMSNQEGKISRVMKYIHFKNALKACGSQNKPAESQTEDVPITKNEHI